MSVNTIKEPANSVCSTLSTNFKTNMKMMDTADKVGFVLAAGCLGLFSAGCFVVGTEITTLFNVSSLIAQVAGGIAAGAAIAVPAYAFLSSHQRKQHQVEIELQQLEKAEQPVISEKIEVKPVQNRTLAQIAYDNRYLILAGVVLTAATIAGVKLGREGIAKLPGQAKEFAVNLPGQAKNFVVNLPTNAQNFGKGALEATKKAPGQAKDFVVSIPTKAQNFGKGALEATKKAPGQAKDFVVSIPTKAQNLGKGALEAGKNASVKTKDIVVGLPGQAQKLGKGALEAGKNASVKTKDIVVGLPGNTLAFGKNMLSKISFKK